MSKRDELVERLQAIADFTKVGHSLTSYEVTTIKKGISTLTAQPAEPVAERETIRVYKSSPEYSGYLKARFAENRGSANSFVWNGKRYRYLHTDFDESGDFDSLLTANTAPPSGVAEGMLKAAEICRQEFVRLREESQASRHAGRDVTANLQWGKSDAASHCNLLITSAAEQINAEGQRIGGRSNSEVMNSDALPPDLGQPSVVAATSAPDTVVVPRDLLMAVLISLRGALDCKSWQWDVDQWQAADDWHDELLTAAGADHLNKGVTS